MQDILSGAGNVVLSTNETIALNELIEKLNDVAGVELLSSMQGQLDHVGALESLDGKTAFEARRIVLGIPPKISNPKLVNGGFEFTVTGDLVGPLRVLYSDDLLHWSVLDHAPVFQLPAVLRDDRPLPAGQRYYRILVTP
jgi:hypothetical protein